MFTSHHLARLFGIATARDIPDPPLVPWELLEPAELPAASLPVRRQKAPVERRLLGG